jgi:hypothetical protein
MGRKKKRKKKRKPAASAKVAPTGRKVDVTDGSAEPGPEDIAPETETPPARAGKRPLVSSVNLREWGPWAICLAAVAFVFLVLKMFAINPYAGDEHIYMYQAKLVSDGVTPYSEFAMAHPPLQSLFTGLVIAIAGYQFTLMRLLPILWCLLAGVLLAAAVRRELGSVASVAAAALFLLSYEPLRAASHATGVNMTMAVLFGAFLAYRKGLIPLTAGLCVAAVFTRLYAAPYVAVLAAWALVADRRRGLKLVAWGAGLGAAAFVAVGIWTGFGDMIHNMLRYHAQKTPMSAERLANMRDTVLFHNATPFSLFALGGPALFAALVRSFNRATDRRGWSRFKTAVTRPRLGLPLLAGAAATTFLLILLLMDRVWMYYFVPAIGLGAIVGGWVVSRWIDAAVRLVRARGRLSRAGVDRPALIAYGVLLALFAFAFARSPALEGNLSYYEKAMAQEPSERVHRYEWRDGMLPGFLNDLVRNAIWRDERTIGDVYFGFTYLLWHETGVLDVTDEMVEEIERRTDEDDEIFGDSGTVPLLALLTGRRIAGNEVDTNIQRYRSGNADPDELVERIDDPRTKLIILRNRFGVTGVEQIKRLVKKKYELASRHRTSKGKLFMIFERK